MDLENPEGKKRNFDQILEYDQNQYVCTGSSDFFNLRRMGFVIDKTMLIAHFLYSPYVVTAALYPRRFGKSTNLDMIRKFFEINYQKSADSEHIDTSVQMNYFTGGEVFNHVMKRIIKLNPMSISSEKMLCSKIMGTFPCIYLDFKCINGTSLDDLYNSLTKMIQSEFKRHWYLEKSMVLLDFEKKDFLIYRDTDLPIFKLNFALTDLSILLQKLWNNQIMVFIDEYDEPIMNSYKNLKDPEKINNFLNTVSSLFTNLLKTNQNVYKSFITGIIHLENGGFLSNLNNKIECTVVAPEYSSGFYGFTEKEVEALKQVYKIDQEYNDLVKNWFNGYVIHGAKIYNPWSVIMCFNRIRSGKQLRETPHEIIKAAFIPHWCATGSIEILSYFFQFSEVRTIINELIEQFYCNLQTGYRIRQLRIIKKMEYDRLVYLAKPTIDLKLSTETESFLTLLLYAGYLTSESLKNEEGFILKIPNNEIVEELNEKLMTFYRKNLGINLSPAIESLKEIMNENSSEILLEKINNFKKSLQDILDLCPEMIKIEEAKARSQRFIGKKT